MIHVQDLVKTFGEVKAVDHISFDVAEGEIFAFLGPNGAGKTTTIQMLTTLVEPTSGAIALDGIDPRQHPHDVRRRFGIVFQDPSLDGELTAYENMELHGVLYHVPQADARSNASNGCSSSSSCGIGAMDSSRRFPAA